MTSEVVGGPEKAAIFILGLGEDLAAEVIKHLAEDELRLLAESADRLDPSLMRVLDATFADFYSTVSDPLPMRSRRAGQFVRGVTTKALGRERASSVFGEKKDEAPAPLAQIKAAPPKTIAALLEEEHPQVAAVILSRLPHDVAVGVLGAMPDDIQTDLLARVAALTEVPQHIADAASDALARALAAAGAVDNSGERLQFDGVAFAARVLNELPRTRSTELLALLEQTNNEVAPKVRQAMFTFEDLLRVNSRAIQVLMREVAQQQLVIALKTASEPLRAHLLSAVSSRAAATIREDMEALPPMKLSEVEAAQKEIVECAMRLANEGRLTIPGGAGEKLV